MSEIAWSFYIVMLMIVPIETGGEVISSRVALVVCRHTEGIRASLEGRIGRTGVAGMSEHLSS